MLAFTQVRQFQWPAKAGWGFRVDKKRGSRSCRRNVSMASKGRMGIQARLRRLDDSSDRPRFNGQQRPDGDSGPGGEGGCGGSRWFQWPAKAGWGFRISMKSVHRCSTGSFQWPAKAGWGFRGQQEGFPAGRTRQGFNGQQRPDGDSGWVSTFCARRLVGCFNGQQRPDGDSG